MNNEPSLKAEPVAWMLVTGHGTKILEKKPYCEVDYWKPLYLHPADLTDEEINKLWAESHEDGIAMQQGFTTQQHYFAHLILRKAQE